MKQSTLRQAKLICALLAVCAVMIQLSILGYDWVTQPVLRIKDFNTDQMYAEVAVSPGDTVYFEWIHSLEKIPWNEYYHIDENLDLVLDTITFPAFGAGIPENKGSVCYVEDGLIHMSGIEQVFSEFIWMNSPTATQEIWVADRYLTRGSDLPHHDRLKLSVERRGFMWRTKTF